MGGGSSRLEDVIGPGLGFGPGSSAPEDLHLLVPPATLASPAPSNLEALRDITGRSTCVGEYQDFVRYFRDRYSRIREILAGRLNARPIDSLRRGDLAGREISVIGMVMEVRTSAKGNRVVELEDPTGMVTAIFQKGVPGSEEVESLVPDEVVGVTGTTDGKGRFFAKALLRPDLEARSAVACGEGGALLLSDVHVGSTYFMEDAWDRFIGWICGEMDDPLGIASTVRYAVIAGDLVDGIGIYPGQEGDLAIKDVWEQYERAAELVSEIPDRIQIVISPGNHDVVRQAEPQPALPEGLRPLFRGNVTFVGNPAAFRLGGVDWLVYHGRSIDDLVLKIPGLSYAEPEKAMVEMLKRRHLSPIYGNRVSIAPEEEDLLVIRRPPGILHSGHVHTVGMARYKGVTAINSGTWQSQTDFQKKMNIQPTPAIVPYLDLSTMRARRLIFA
ncbi:MAG: DNA-directed DNA polymerase II small subunit [Methanothrix sp.]|jgi:DNA polymerase II small subunit|nr:DNA-directed DNA polymerase II small subunit [Methanothrix sp.]